jgi:hypothetical protein
MQSTTDVFGIAVAVASRSRRRPRRQLVDRDGLDASSDSPNGEIASRERNEVTPANAS